jgi:rod shape-determining protein MreD
MIIVYTGLVVLISLLFQTTVANYFLETVGVKPDLLLVLALVLGLTRGKGGGVALGCLLGFLQDIMSGGLLGINALSKGLIGFGAGTFRRDLMSFHPLLQAFIFALAIAFDTALNLILGFLLSPLPGGVQGITGILLRLMVLHAVIGPPILWVFSRVESRWTDGKRVRGPALLRKQR